jgi:ABC-type phosphate transport system permease subunit
VADPNPTWPAGSLQAICIASPLCAMLALLLARINGPREIRDTIWACLDITKTPSPTTEA